MSQSPKPPAPSRPFSFQAKDFLKDAPQELRDASTATSPDAPPPPEAEESDSEPPSSFRRPDAAPEGSAGQASTHSRRMVNLAAEKPKHKVVDHTILMAVPPPAQENDGD